MAAANLSDDHKPLVRATAFMELNEMKNNLQRVFGEHDGRKGDEHDETLPIKEKCLYMKGHSHHGHRHHEFNQVSKHQRATTKHKRFN